MGYLTVHRICRIGPSREPRPPYGTLAAMLAQLADALADTGHKPVAVDRTEAWPLGEDNTQATRMLVRLRIQCEPGEGTRSLASWFQWQHPGWCWSVAALPTVACEMVERAILVPIAPLPLPPGFEAHP
jgi:hypothetical protein